MSLSHLSFDRLKGRENYSFWKIGAKAHLTTKGYFDCVLTDKPDSATAEVTLKYEKALAELTLLVDVTVYSHLEECDTVKKAWEVLKDAFEDRGAVRKVTLLKQWVTLKLEDCSSMQEYITKSLQFRSKIKAAGMKIDEELAGTLMLVGLSNDFRPMVMSVESMEREITVDYVKNLLTQEVDHEAAECEKVLAANHKKAANLFKKKKDIKCFECGGPHFKRKCPKLKEASENAVFYSSFMANVSDTDWIIDSGATAHMTKNKSCLMNIQKPLMKEVTVANNQKIIIDSVGEVNHRVKTDNDISDIKLKNVQYVPGICVNLLSVSQIVQRGHEVVFSKNGCKIFDAKKKVIATGSLINNMFKLDTVPIEIACSAKSDQKDIVLWHRKLGHASIAKMNKVLNMNIKNNLKCEVCLKGKQTRLPFSNIGTRATNLLEIVHSDVCGPLSVSSIGGARYIVTFIDDRSRKVFAYTIKQKSEVFAKFVEFTKFAENQTEKK